MNRQTSLLFSIVAIAVLLTSVIAVFLLSRPLNNNGIIGAADLDVVREDNGQLLTEIYWGTFSLPTVVSKQSLDVEVLGTTIMLKNTGVVPLVVGWNTTNLPDYLSLTATWSGNPYPQNDYNQFRIDPGYQNGYVVFTLTITDLSTTATSFAFTIWFNAMQAP